MSKYIDFRVHKDAGTPEEREAFERGQREADELWERIKNGYNQGLQDIILDNQDYDLRLENC